MEDVWTRLRLKIEQFERIDLEVSQALQMDIHGPFKLKDFSTKSNSTDGFSPRLDTEPSSQPIMLNS